MNQLEKTYQEILLGHEEPTVMWGPGHVFKYMSRRMGWELLADSEGNPIQDTACYQMDSSGLHLFLMEG